jgi:hypothetical protein
MLQVTGTIVENKWAKPTSLIYRKWIKILDKFDSNMLSMVFRIHPTIMVRLRDKVPTQMRVYLAAKVEGWLRCKTRDTNIVGSISITGHLACDRGQVTLLRSPRPLNES